MTMRDFQNFLLRFLIIHIFVFSLCTCNFVDRIALRVVDGTGTGNIFPLSTSSIGSHFNVSFIFAKLVPTKPIDACSRIVNSNEVQNGIAFVIRGKCSFVTKASFAQAAGAVAFIAYDYMNNSARILNMVPDETATQVLIPCAFMQGSYAQKLISLMEAANKTSLDVDFPVDANGVPIIAAQYTPLRLW
uniref:PA domain-containing protein n=1 Tax=Mesocestoides corti TaxID=53468 RepID=A0A5K3FDY4_MESCO